MDVEDHVDQDQTRRHWLRDALPLGTPSAPDSKVETGSLTKETAQNPSILEKNKHSSDPTDIPRYQTYFQVFVSVYDYSLFSCLFFPLN